MPLPVHHTFNTIDLTAYTPSCGASPVAAYVRVPFRSTLRKFTGILGGAITTADCTVTVAVNGTTVGTFTATQAGSAAGLLFSGAPTTLALSQVNEDDVISLTPSGASGASVPMHFSVVVREA
jgi:hypothetical protein